MNADVEVVVAHSERVTLRVGDVFLKIDADQTRLTAEVEAMALAPIPTPEVLWHTPPVLALRAVRGVALGRLGEPPTASARAWAAAGAVLRRLHSAPLPPRIGPSLEQIAHVFVDGDTVSGVIDWSEACQGDALYDIATLTLGHEERLGDVVAGYGGDVDPGVIRGWWSLRSLRAARWLIEHGFGPSSPRCEFAVLRSQMRG